MTNKEAIEILTNVKNTPQIEWLNGADVAFDLAIKTLDGWDELKETIVEMRDNNGTGTQQEVCKFLVNLMGVIEEGRK